MLKYIYKEQNLLIGKANGSIEIFTRDSREKLLILEGHSDLIFCLAVSSDFKYIATAGNDKSVKLWRPCIFEDINTVRNIRTGVFGEFYKKIFQFMRPVSYSKDNI